MFGYHTGQAQDRGKMQRNSLRIRIFPTLFAALLLFLGTGSSPAADFPAGSAPAATDNTAGAATPAFYHGLVDRTHARVEEDLFHTVVWFDRFFGDEWMVVSEQPKWFLRWTNEPRWDEEDRFSFRSTVRASLRLPRFKKRWRLVISSESQGDPNAIIPEDPGNPGLDTGSQVRTSSTGLFYDIFRTPRSLLEVGAGVRVKIPPNAFVRTRFRHERPIAHDILGRFTGTAYWDARDGFGESNQVDLERRLAPPTLLRWSNSITITEISRWWTWGTDLSLLHMLSPKSAITFAVGASGSTHPSWVATNYRILARYRRNVWRKWLFLEGEPDIHWPRKEDGSRKPVWGATLRMEILFAGVDPNPLDVGGSGP